MYGVIRCMSLEFRKKANQYLGQRGAEMVEYAIVLACIAAIGVMYYKVNGTSTGGTGTTTLNGILTDLWTIISTKADNILGTK